VLGRPGPDSQKEGIFSVSRNIRYSGTQPATVPVGGIVGSWGGPYRSLVPTPTPRSRVRFTVPPRLHGLVLNQAQGHFFFAFIRPMSTFFYDEVFCVSDLCVI
jgi:hypothetical protein